jgi:hypothetical protein
MATTYDKIATTTLGSAGTITFSSIPSTYTDLKLVFVAQMDSGYQAYWLRFNSDSGTNYSTTYLTGNGATASSGRTTSGTKIILGQRSGQPNVFTMYQIDLFSYAGSTYKTSLISEAADINGAGNASGQVNLWSSTSAITSINLLPATGNFSTGTTATLYGILKA